MCIIYCTFYKVSSVRRFRQMPVFGRFSIRRFSNNVSELKQLAAHNFEDILQVRQHVRSGLLLTD